MQCRFHVLWRVGGLDDYVNVSRYRFRYAPGPLVAAMRLGLRA
jgi:hypothetical protein